MRKKIIIFVVIALVLLGGYFVSNYPREHSRCVLNNGISISIKTTENILAMRDPVVTQELVIDYGDRTLTNSSDSDLYDYYLFLIAEGVDTFWIAYDGRNKFKSSFNDEQDEFEQCIVKTNSTEYTDTICSISYTNFKFNIEGRIE
ncbi:MAG: hypothetical protein HRT58_18780 [Crocinitomicaceae bacterium]|nr:hypothetical protein [Flavobacteriales bacterium]NQZ37716.1 hypothetical protein [Crocinitomicaceae bacterium]